VAVVLVAQLHSQQLLVALVALVAQLLCRRLQEQSRVMRAFQQAQVVLVAQ